MQKPFVKITELAIDANIPTTTVNISKIIGIHDMHIRNNFHNDYEYESKDIIDMLETNETTQQNEEILNRATSRRRKSTLYGYLIKHKWYEEKINSHFTSEEINDALRGRKDIKSVWVDPIPSEIYKIFRTKWVYLYKKYSKKYITKE